MTATRHLCRLEPTAYSGLRADMICEHNMVMPDVAAIWMQASAKLQMMPIVCVRTLHMCPGGEHIQNHIIRRASFLKHISD